MSSKVAFNSIRAFGTTCRLIFVDSSSEAKQVSQTSLWWFPMREFRNQLSPVPLLHVQQVGVQVHPRIRHQLRGIKGDQVLLPLRDQLHRIPASRVSGFLVFWGFRVLGVSEFQKLPL
jgi:hypothetical protein